MCITELQQHSLYSNIMLLLGNERPNFPTNRMKRINKGMMQIIGLIFQTEGGGERGLVERGAYYRNWLSEGGGGAYWRGGA